MNLFKSLFGNKDDRTIKYNLSSMAGGHANDLKVICDHFDELLDTSGHSCQINNGFHLCTGNIYDMREGDRHPKQITQRLIFMIMCACIDTIDHTSHRKINRKPLHDTIKSSMSLLYKQDLLSCDRKGSMIMFFTGIDDETSGTISRVAAISLEWHLKMENYRMRIDVPIKCCTYTDFEILRSHVARVGETRKQ
jgi:hypothetical protein